MVNTVTFGFNLYKYRKISFFEKDKDGRFEGLMQAYLRTDPKDNAPTKPYQYIVNGKNAIEWIVERSQVTVDLKRETRKRDQNDPNYWAKEVGNPRYILDLLLSVINVGVKTVGIEEGWPKVKFE